MLPLASIAVATILLAAIAATVASKGTSAEIEERSEIFGNPDVVVHYEDAEREKREEEEEASHPLRRESSADELAAAVGTQNVGYQGTGNYANEHPRRAVGDAWRDAVPGTPGMDYPNLDGIPVTSFSCADKEPGGYYADVETGCQVFHVCNTGGVKSSFLCPPGNIFNQRYFVCDWWYGVNCQEAVDLHFAKPEENFADPGDDGVSSIFENSETTEFPTPARQESGIRNYANPSNDLSPASTGGYLSSGGSGRMDDSSRSENNVRDHSSDSGTFVNRHNGAATDDNAPRGFSRNDDKSSKRRKLDRPATHRDLTNDLASYVNYAYFQAGLKNNGDDDDDDNRDTDNYGKTEEDYSTDTSFGDRLTQEKSSRRGYYEDDTRGAPSFKSVDGYE